MERPLALRHHEMPKYDGSKAARMARAARREGEEALRREREYRTMRRREMYDEAASRANRHRKRRGYDRKHPRDFDKLVRKATRRHAKENRGVWVGGKRRKTRKSRRTSRMSRRRRTRSRR